MFVGLSLIAGSPVVNSMAVASIVDDAELVAIRLGRVIGAAAACGARDGDLHALEIKVHQWMHEVAGSNEIYASSEVAFSASVADGGMFIWRNGGSLCHQAIREFNGFIAAGQACDK